MPAVQFGRGYLTPNNPNTVASIVQFGYSPDKLDYEQYGYAEVVHCLFFSQCQQLVCQVCLSSPGMDRPLQCPNASALWAQYPTPARSCFPLPNCKVQSESCAHAQMPAVCVLMSWAASS